MFLALAQVSVHGAGLIPGLFALLWYVIKFMVGLLVVILLTLPFSLKAIKEGIEDQVNPPKV